MRRATLYSLQVGALFLTFGAARAEATIVFDFSGVCLSGDCEPGSETSGVLAFDEGAGLHHRDRAVSASDFVSLVIEYFATVSKARVQAHYRPAEGGVLQDIDVLVDAADELQGIALRDDVQNAFEVDALQQGAWRYRQVQFTPQGQLEIDLTLEGRDGVFVRRAAAAPEPTTLALMAAALAVPWKLRRRKKP